MVILKLSHLVISKVIIDKAFNKKDVINDFNLNFKNTLAQTDRRQPLFVTQTKIRRNLSLKRGVLTEFFFSLRSLEEESNTGYEICPLPYFSLFAIHV